MILREPDRSPYDLVFRIGEFPVRIAWTFWLMTAVFGYNFVDYIDYLFLSVYGLWSPSTLPLLLIWSACVLVSITVHELGHALAFRRYGIHSQIVLYHFGGLAIPLAANSPTHSVSRLSAKENLVIAAAGPGAQLLLAAAVILLTRTAGYEVHQAPDFLQSIPGVAGGNPIMDVGLYTLVNSLVWPSVVWALFNLIPVWPLDGGRIAREVIAMLGGNIRHSLGLSIVVGAAMVVVGFMIGQWFMAILFASLLMGNWQEFQRLGQWRSW
ncbi:Peptidase family M50 [Roseimaritima multifibrata]|uniref:Peptidase family M50 n=1 Tax=Roseimaritima multifibrata TaxID=1930274 RepID=A0A517MKN2_9BACT|nr:site-2 protease family protein [Roseimaritima multifibrata]QDS95446.1 Peptidase family M50 [Roseimaritima multifibrata]